MKSLLSIFLIIGMSSIATATGNKHVKSTVIEFDRGITQLTRSQKDDIKQLFNSSMLRDKDLDVGLAAWADEPFPGEKNKLSDAQREIANKRIKSIRRVIDDLKVDIDDINTYSMAEGSNWLARMFNTESSELKSMFSMKDKSSALMKEKYRIFKEEGAAKKAVLVINLDE